MGRMAWPVRPLPDGRGELWRWRLAGLGDLPSVRSGLRDQLGVIDFSDDDADSAVEHLILAFDELASNALRHAAHPVVATVIAGSGGWLVDVSDGAPEAAPAPAVDRDPAQGGLGLYLIARLSVAHGWYVDGGCKHVWACLPSSAGDRTPALV